MELKFRPVGTTRFSSFFALGFNSIQARNYQLAIQCYQRILQEEPNEQDALLRLGQMYALTWKKKDAEATQKLLKVQNKELANQLKAEISQPDKVELLYANTCANNPNGTARPSIYVKDKARYTELARSQGVQGVVVVSVVLTADGRLSRIRILRGLPDGLNEESIKAAKTTKFRPACKNGKYVSVRMSMEFTFNLS